MLRKRKSKILIILFIVMIILTGCDRETEATRFKREYESFNDKLSVVNIPEDNPFVYKTQEEILSLIDTEKAFVVFYGNPQNEDCRAIIDTIINEAKTSGLKTIYYVETKDTDEYQVQIQRIEQLPSLIAVVKRQFYAISNTSEYVNVVIGPVAKELNTCDINNGGC